MGSIRRAAVVVTALTAVSTVLGLLRDVVIAAVFGAGAELDAFLVAQGLMNVVLGLVAGAVAKSAVPVLARQARAEGPTCRSHPTFDTAVTVTCVVLGLAGVVMALYAGPVVGVLAPGFGEGEALLAEQLTRVMLLATVLVAGTNLLAAVANAHGRFAWSAVQGIPFNLAMIAAAAIWGPQHGALAIAGGFVVGSGLRLLTQLPPVRQLGMKVRASLRLSDAGFREMSRLVPALLLTSALVNVNTMVDRAVASTFEGGTISALSYGWRLVTLGETVLVASLVTALYPAMGAAAAVTGDLQRLLSRGVRASTVLLAPVVAVLVCAAVPLVTLAFGRGSFTADDVERTALSVAWYAPALLAMGWREIVVRASYALGDSRGPVVVAVVAMLINVVGDLTVGVRYGISALAASTTVSLVAAAILNSWLLRRRHGLRTQGVMDLAPTALATAVAVLVGLWVADVVEAAAATSGVDALGDCALVGGAVLGAYGLVLVSLRSPDVGLLREVVANLRQRRG